MENADETEVRRRTVEGNAKFRELTVNLRKINISTDDTEGNGGPQADFVGEQGLINDD